MTLEQALYNYLSTYAGLTALVGTRIYPVNLPQGAARPCVLYQRVSTRRQRTMGSPRLGAVPRIQVTTYAATYLEQKAIGLQLLAALEGYSGTMGGGSGVVVQAVQLDNEMDDYDPDLKDYQGVQDFMVWHLGD